MALLCIILPLVTRIRFLLKSQVHMSNNKTGRAGSQFKAKKVADEFADYCSFYYDQNPSAPDQSVLCMMKDFLAQHALITEDERQWAPQTCREVELWIGTSIEKYAKIS